MMAFRSSRTFLFKGLVPQLAGLLALLLPAAAGADEPAVLSPPVAVAVAVPAPASDSLVDPESQVPGLLAAGRCDAALKTLLNMDPSQRHAHEMIWFCRVYRQCGEPKDTLAACSVVANQGEMFSLAERQEAQSYAATAMSQYQPLAPYVSAPVAVAPAPVLPVPPVVAPLPRQIVNDSPDTPPTWEGQSRFYFHGRPLWSLVNITGSVLVDVGFEHIFKSGLLLGAELSPIALTYPLLGINVHGRIGYGSRKFTIGVSGGIGASGPDGGLSYQPQLGFFFRAGRLDRTYVEFSMNLVFIKANPTVPIPFDGLLHISSKTAENWRFKMDIGGSYYLYGPYLLLGGERQLKSSTERVRSAVNFGFGLVFPVLAYGIPGPMFSIGYEKRF